MPPDAVHAQATAASRDGKQTSIVEGYEMVSLACIFFILLVVGVLVFFAAKARSERQREIEAQDRQWAQTAIENLEAAADDTSKLPDLNDRVTNLILHPGERCFAIGQDAQHVVAAHRTSYVGGSHGVSFRIAKGVRYHVGGFKGRRVTTTYEKVHDVGSLYVTTERVVFAGSREVTSIAGKKIADVRIEGDHVWVLAENRKTPLGLRLRPALALVMAYATRLLAQNQQA
jgi:hypothetical protein